MKHIVFILSSYYPYFSAVGRCVYNVAHYLKNNYDVTVLAVANHDGQEEYDQCDNCQIVRVCTPMIKRRLFWEKQSQQGSNIMKKVAPIVLLHEKIYKYLQAVVKYENIDRRLCKSYVRALREINQIKKIDVLIPVCMPFEAMVAASKYCEQVDVAPQVISYFFDPFSDNHSLHRFSVNQKLKYSNHLSLEKDVIDHSSHIIIMEHLKKHFEEEFFYAVDKIHVMEHPMLCPPNSEKMIVSNKVPQITYAGSFNKGIREPDFLLKVIDKLEVNAHWNIYAVGNCSDIIENFASRCPEHLYFGGQVSKEKADQAIACSDFILSVGNMVSNQSPSKIFECISTGKPIIHFFYYKEDPVNQILRRYPNALCIEITDVITKDVLEQLQDFIHSAHSKLSFDEVSALYPMALPQITADVMHTIIQEIEK